jgi:hypothetical protein
VQVQVLSSAMTTVRLRLCALEEQPIPGSDYVWMQQAADTYSIGSKMTALRLKALYTASMQYPITEARSYIYKIDKILQTVENYKKPFDIDFKTISIQTQKSDLNFLIWSTLNFHSAFQAFLFSATSCYSLTPLADDVNNTAFYLYRLIPRIQAVQKKLNHRIEAARILASHLPTAIIDIFDEYTE